jgi:hypothetical protein
MKTMEIEKRYKVHNEDRDAICDFCNTLFSVVYRELDLIDYRFDIKDRGFERKDYQRLRTVFDVQSKSQTLLWSQKYTDENNIRHETEKEINAIQAQELIKNTTGRTTRKRRLYWEGSVVWQSVALLGFSVALDSADNNTGYMNWELEIVSENDESRLQYYVLFDSIVQASGIEYSQWEK